MAALGAGLGTVAAAPISARAQTGSARRLGVLMNSNPADTIQHSYWEALIAALKDAGWTEGQNISIETRWTEGDPN